MLETRGAGDDSWRDIDRTLADTESAFDFLTLASPTNVEEAWEAFRASGCERPPELRSPPIDEKIFTLQDRIADLPFEDVGDSDLRFILTGKHAELSWQLEMLKVRDTDAFLIESMLHYGPVSHELLETAKHLVEVLPIPEPDSERASAEEVRERAEEELRAYRQADPSVDSEIIQQEDQEGLQASHGDLLIPTDIEMPPRRLEALVQHEVGAHVVTHHNGEEQPLQVLRNGLADYDEVQEAFGVIAEYFAGGLTSVRMRTLAGRTLAVSCLEDGADFVETFRRLRDEIEVGPSNAFSMTARIYACGGLTRDQIYLRGLLWLLRYLRSGGDLEPLYIGKIGLHQIPAVRRLRGKGFLSEPAVHPAFLVGPAAEKKLRRLREGVGLEDLVIDR